MFIITFFTIAQKGKQLKCLLTHEWIKTMWLCGYDVETYLHMCACISIWGCMYAGVYMMKYSAMKQNEILPFVTRMSLEGIMLNELRQRKTSIGSHMWNLEKIKKQRLSLRYREYIGGCQKPG